MQLRGITIRIHPTFVGLLLICALGGLAVRAIIVFGIVILHELFHVLAARGYGIKVKSIELYPYGGTAVLEDTFEGKRKEETVIAFAGPAFNFALFLLLQFLRWEGILNGEWVLEVVKINFWLACFNLIPVMPLDGGRIARAFFSGTFGFVKTTKFLAAGGKWVGGIFVLLGFALQGFGYYLYEPPLFIVLGVFFWIGSEKEIAKAKIVFLKQLCRKKEQLLNKGLMRSNSFTVPRDTPLRRIMDELASDRYSLINVLGRKDKIEKTFSETEIVQGMMDRGLECKVGDLV
ncbi:MAG: putative zinc metalloprotease Rip3 [Candidatus Dichloromethanomonas elyunquensis]|nr:MAG: putative zinc metalloprotease Rip3 [Candidatus Dichloromethanomonas elyunquensis]